MSGLRAIALDRLARHRGLYKDQLPATAFPNTPIEIRLVKAQRELLLRVKD